MTDRAVLQTEIEASGMVSGRNVAVRSIDDIKRAAVGGADGLGKFDRSLRGIGASLQSSNAAGSASVRTLGEQIRQATGLARAYTQGAAAVERYNVELKVEEALVRANLAAASTQGRVLANMVRQREAATAAVERERAALAQRTAAAEAEAVASANQVGILGRLQAAYLAAAVAGGVVIGILKSLAEEAMEAEENERRLTSAVERRGAAFGVTSQQLLKMSADLQSVTTFEDDAVQKAQAVLLRFDEINADNIEEVTKATLDFAAATGRDAATAAVDLGKALLVPGEAMRTLKEVGITLTQSQQDLVDTWNTTGQSAKSVSLIVGMLNDKIGGEANAKARTGAGGIDQFNNALGDLKTILGSGLIPDLHAAAERLGFFNEALAAKFKASADDHRGAFQMAEDARLTAAAIEYLAKVQKEYAAQNFVGPMQGVAAQALTAEEIVKAALARQKEFLDGFNKAKETADAAAKAIADRYQDLKDKAQPAAAAARKLAEDVAFMREQMARLKLPLDEQNAFLGGLTGNWKKYGQALESEVIPQLDAVKSRLDSIKEMKVPSTTAPTMKLDSVETDLSRIYADMDQAPKDFTNSLAEGLGQSVASFGREFLETGELNVKRLGDMLLDTLLNAAQQYFATMVANQAKLKMAGGGGGGGMGGLGSLFGGGGGVSSGAMALGAWVAIAAAAVAILKHQDDRREAQRINTSVNLNTYEGGSSSFYTGGRLMETGKKIETAFAELLRSVESSTGAFVDGAHRISIGINNEKSKFTAMFDGVAVGVFSSAEEAMVAGLKKMFAAENISKVLDPIVQQVIENFDAAKGPEAFAAAVESVNQIVNGLSGLTEVEISLRDIPVHAQQLAGELHAMGVAMDDANAVAARWTVQQFASLRDQITGHQATAAEQRAEKERQAAFFNAQLALTKANQAMMKADLEYKIANFKEQVEWTNKKYEFDLWKMNNDKRIVENQMDLAYVETDIAAWGVEQRGSLAQQSAEIAQAEVTVRQAAGQASIEILRAQLEAINQSMAALEAIKPINMSEIHLPGGSHGGGASSGPSRAEQIADFLKEIDQTARGGLPQAVQAIMDLSDRLAEMSRRAAELGVSEERIAAARQALIDQQKASILDPVRQYLDPSQGGTAGMNQWEQGSADIRRAFEEARAANQALIDETGERAIAFWRLNEAEIAALHTLAEEAVDSLGLPLENTRDQIAAWTDTLAFLAESLESGAMSAERYGEVIGQVAQQAEVQFLTLAQSILDQMGATKESAAIKAKLEEANFLMQIAQLNLLFNALSALGKLGQELQDKLAPILGFINDPANWPDFGDLSGGGGSGNGYDNAQSAIEAARARREQALISALDRLRAIQERYVEFRENLATSELSGATLRQRSDEALAQYQQTLAQAQAGNLDAMANAPDLANQYLQLLSQFIDPSSAQYQAMRDQILSDMAGIEGGIAGVLAGAQSPAQQQVQELQNIGQILTEMRDLWGIVRPWNPGGGMGTILPGPSTGGGGVGGSGWDTNPHAGQVYYGPDWGWHPMGWSPGGSAPPDPFASTSRTRAGATVVSDPAAAVALRGVADRLLRIEAKLENGFSKSAGATDRQTEFFKSAGTINASSRSRQKWTSDRDQVAS